MLAQLAQSLMFPGYTFGDQAAAVTLTGTVIKECAIPANNAANYGTETGGTATLQTGHTIVSSTTTSLIDVYWTGGRRYCCTGVKTSNEIALTGGTGDSLPGGGTAVILYQQIGFEINFDGDNGLFVAVMYRNPTNTAAKGIASFWDTGLAIVKTVDLIHETANGGIKKGSNVWNIYAGDTNDFTGNRITKVYCSHNAYTAGTAYVLVGQ